MSTVAAMALVGSHTRVVNSPATRAGRRSLCRVGSLGRSGSPITPLTLPGDDLPPTSLSTILSPPLVRTGGPTWQPAAHTSAPFPPLSPSANTAPPPTSALALAAPTRGPAPQTTRPLKIVVPSTAPRSSNPRSTLPSNTNGATPSSASSSATSRYLSFPVFKPDGDLDVRYVNQQHVFRKRRVAHHLLLFAAIYVVLEIPYILHSQWVASLDYVPLVLRCVNALLIYVAVSLNRRLYVARFITQTTERFDALVCMLMVASSVLLCAAETQRRRSESYDVVAVDVLGVPTAFEVHLSNMDRVLEDGLLLGLSLIYAFSAFVRMRWFFLCLVGLASLVAYVVAVLVADMRSTRYLLISLAYQLLILAALVAMTISNEAAKGAIVGQQSLQFLERKKAEQLLRSMLPVRILSDYLDGSMGQLQANATIGFVQMHLGQLIERPGPPGSHQAASPQAIASPGELMQKLHDTYKRIDSIVTMYSIRGINKVETVASTYLLCAGLLQDIDDHAAAMVDVSLEIMAMVTTRLNMGGAGKKRIPVFLRIGISSGPVVGGIIGAQRRFFRVFGDTVNVAARMCTNVAMGCIQLSPSCYAALSDRQRAAYKIAEGVSIDIKGKGLMTCRRIEARADWVPKHGKMAMNRGQARDEPLLNKSFVYHKLLARTELGPWDLLFKQEHGAGHLEKQATFVRTAKTASPGPHAATTSPVRGHAGSTRRLASARDLVATTSDEGVPAIARAPSLVPLDAAVKSVVGVMPFRATSASRFRAAESGSCTRLRARSSASNLPAAPPSKAEPEVDSPYGTVSIERFFQLSHASAHQTCVRGALLLFGAFLVGLLIYLVEHHPRASATAEWDSSVDSASPMAMIAALLFVFLLLLFASFAEALWTRLASCEPCADASLDSTPLEEDSPHALAHGHPHVHHMQQQPPSQLSANAAGGSPNLSGLHGGASESSPSESHFLRHLQAYLLAFSVLTHVWVLVGLHLWGVEGDFEVSPVFALLLLSIFSCFLLRLQFRLLAPLVGATWLCFAAIMIADRVSYVHLLLVLSHLLVGVWIGLSLVYSSEAWYRGSFLLAYALEKEQESMDLFLNNLLPKDVVLVLKKQNPALARDIVRASDRPKIGQAAGSVARARALTINSTSTAAAGGRAAGVRSMSLGSEGVASRFAMHFPRTTVFESDIVGYTEMVSHLSPSDTLNLLNLIFSRFDQAAHACGVEKIETIGDAFMCMVFDGLPDPVLDFALRVVDDLQECSRETNPRQDLQIRMGIATGSCFGGVVGTEIPRFHLFGRCHDVAIHIEQSGRPGCIIVSAPTYALSSERYEYEPLDLRVDDVDTFLLKAKLPEEHLDDEFHYLECGDWHQQPPPPQEAKGQPVQIHTAPKPVHPALARANFASIAEEGGQGATAAARTGPPSAQSLARSLVDVAVAAGTTDSPAATDRARSLIPSATSTNSNASASATANTTTGGHRPTGSGSIQLQGITSNSTLGASPGKRNSGSGNGHDRGSGNITVGSVLIHTSLSAVASAPLGGGSEGDLVISQGQFIDPAQVA